MRTNTGCYSVFAAILSACALVASSAAPAAAADHPLEGTRLLAKSRGSKQTFVWISKDVNAVFPLTSPASAGATLFVKAGDGDSSGIALSASYWRLNAGGSRTRYANSDAPDGDSLCRLALIADHKALKVVCRSDLIDTLDAGAEGGVDVELVIGDDRYCASFGGDIREESGTFQAAAAPAPAQCPQVTPTTLEPCPPTTTTTLPVCGDFDPPYFPQCADSMCPSPQECIDDGSGHCGCTGPPVPCGQVYPVGLCSLGDCPPGQYCGVTSYGPPACYAVCECH